MDVGATKMICSLNLFALAFLMFSRICLHLQYAPIQLLVVPRTSELLKDIKVCNVHAKFFCVRHAYYVEQFPLFYCSALVARGCMLSAEVVQCISHVFYFSQMLNIRAGYRSCPGLV